MNDRICIVAEDYPSKGNPSFPFVQQLAYSLSNEGFDCSVIAPQSITKALFRCEKLKKRNTIDKSPEYKEVKVYRPLIATFSNTKNKWLNRITNYLYEIAISNTVKRTGKFDTVYCYFWHMGLITAKVLKDNSQKLVVQASECSITINDYYKTYEAINRIDGVVCASRKNYEESVQNGLINQYSNAVIIPNGFREDEFYNMNRACAREKLGFDKSIFIIAFVGDFNDRKGSRKLSAAIDCFEDVYSIFIGKGNEHPTCKNVLFEGTVNHNDLCAYLNCADIFVLPTKAEGCCNAIIEAIACGLPVISSNKSFNDEILDDSYSIRINENSVDEITEAIERLKNDNQLRKQMSENALKAACKFRITNRAKAIASFIRD